MEYRIIVGLLLVSTLFISACDNVDLSKVSDKDLERVSNNLIVCNKPYIRFASSCCLDKDSNSICDKDERELTSTERQEEVEANEEAQTSNQQNQDTSPKIQEVKTLTEQDISNFNIGWSPKSLSCEDYNSPEREWSDIYSSAFNFNKADNLNYCCRRFLDNEETGFGPSKGYRIVSVSERQELDSPIISTNVFQNHQLRLCCFLCDGDKNPKSNEVCVTKEIDKLCSLLQEEPGPQIPSIPEEPTVS